MPDAPRPTRKRIRLPAENYLGDRSYFVTICCYKRKPFFRDADRAHRLLERLRVLAGQHSFRVHAYCIMPDHFHLLVEGSQAESNLLRFINQLKQESAHQEKSRSRFQLWQRYFYDHILRPRDSMEAVAWYIWLNPVRKGLCAEPEDYPLSGSFTAEWKRKTRPAVPWNPPWKDSVGAGL